MSRKRPAMPDALGALLGASSELANKPQRLATTLPTSDLKSGMAQPRRAFDSARLEGLAASIRQQGIVQPLLVRPVADGYEIVAGERRWRAAKLAELQEVPVIIRELSDHAARQVALIENLQREDLNTVDEVDAKLDLVATTLHLSRDEARLRLMQLLREPQGEEHEALERLFSALGEQWQSFTRNKLKILKWPETVLEAVRGGLSYTVAQAVVAAPAEQHAYLLTLALKGASIKEIKQESQRLTAQPTARAQATRVGRVLSSARWLAKLDTKQQKALDSWLAKMPDVVREALED